MSKKYDVIIIGAGIGGLVCGTKLAKKGSKVLIVEKHNKPGGCVTSCKKNGYTFDYGAHIFGSCNKNGILNYCLKELGIENIEFIRFNPTERFIFPDQVIEVPQNFEHYRDYLEARYPKERKNIELFFKEVLKIAKHFSSETLLSKPENNSFLSKYETVTFEELLRNHFQDEKLMSILSAQFAYLGATPKNLAATSMCLMMVSYLRDGTYYPKGGAQKFPDVIASKFKEYGGKILLNEEVTQIVIKNGKATGVKTRNSKIYESNTIVSNADAIKTFFNMINKQEVDTKYLEKMRKMKIASSYFLTFLGVKDNLDLKNKSGWYHFSYGLDLKPKQSLYIFVPSLINNSAAPKYKHIIELAIRFPYEFNTVKNWSSCKRELRDEILNTAAKIITGLKNSIEFEESATPKTIEKYTGNSHGSAAGWEMSIDQIHKKRLSHETPINGLYLTGHWTNSGCGVVPVATSGWIVADKIIKSKKQLFVNSAKA